jgi:hypothetical protein
VLQLTAGEKYYLNADHMKNVCEMMGLEPECILLCVENFDDTTVQGVNNDLDEWMCYLKHNIIPKEFTAPGLKEAREQLRYGNLSGQEKLDYDHHTGQLSYERSLTDSAVFYSEYEGNYEAERCAKNAAGLKKGETVREALVRTSINIHRTGLYSVDAISIIMGLSTKQITEILTGWEEGKA